MTGPRKPNLWVAITYAADRRQGGLNHEERWKVEIDMLEQYAFANREICSVMQADLEIFKYITLECASKSLRLLVYDSLIPNRTEAYHG